MQMTIMRYQVGQRMRLIRRLCRPVNWSCELSGSRGRSVSSAATATATATATPTHKLSSLVIEPFASSSSSSSSSSCSPILPYFGRQPEFPGTIHWPFTSSQPGLFLGIETTCDDTSMAIITHDRRILAHATHSQHLEHKPFGGIVPTIANQQHIQHLPQICDEVLAQANIKPTQLTAIAVAAGPGLPFSLEAGVNFAREFCKTHQKPLVAVHHLEAHAMVSSLIDTTLITRPSVVLMATGGHTQVWAQRSVGDITILGESADIAIGNYLDRIGKMLQLETNHHMHYAAAVEEYAVTGDPHAVKFTVPMRASQDCYMSFAGLLSAVDRLCQKICIDNQVRTPRDFSQQLLSDICASAQEVAFQHVADKLENAFALVDKYGLKVRRLNAVGGVMCNKALAHKLAILGHPIGVKLVVPPKEWCTDNGVMIANLGALKYAMGQRDTLHLVYQPTPWPVGMQLPPLPKYDFKQPPRESSEKQSTTSPTQLPSYVPLFARRSPSPLQTSARPRDADPGRKARGDEKTRHRL